MNNNNGKDVLETLKEILFSSGLLDGHYKKERLSLFVDSRPAKDFTIMFDAFGKEWTQIKARGFSGDTEIRTYNHIISEDFISTKVLPILEDLIKAEGLSENQKKVSKIADLYLEKQRIDEELKELNAIDRKEVEGE